MVTVSMLYLNLILFHLVSHGTTVVRRIFMCSYAVMHFCVCQDPQVICSLLKLCKGLEDKVMHTEVQPRQVLARVPLKKVCCVL